jgi:hypothetical protein
VLEARFGSPSSTKLKSQASVIEFNLQVNALIVNLQMRLEMIVKWLKDSGL